MLVMDGISQADYPKHTTWSSKTLPKGVYLANELQINRQMDFSSIYSLPTFKYWNAPINAIIILASFQTGIYM